MRTAVKDSPTKARLLDAAQELMMAKGFAATTVEEICDAAKLTKGSFFHYFDSKDRLGKEVLERFCASGSRLHAACCGDESDPLKRVYGYIDGMVKLSQTPPFRSCLLGTFAQELSDVQPVIRKACACAFDAWAKQFGKEVAAAKRRYAPRASFDPYSVAEHFIAVLEGALILAKARDDQRVVAEQLGHFRRYVQSLFGGKT